MHSNLEEMNTSETPEQNGLVVILQRWYLHRVPPAPPGGRVGPTQAIPSLQCLSDSDPSGTLLLPAHGPYPVSKL